MRDDTGAFHEVSLVGHDTGVEFGDRVAVTGLPVGGCHRALWIRNELTGRTLFRAGLFRAALGLILLVVAIRAVLSIGVT